MTGPLAASYSACARVTRQSASSFYYSFLILPRSQRRGMVALYAFLRHTDDLGDNSGSPAERRRALVAWRGALRAALEGDFQSPLLPALVDTLQRFEISPDYLFTAIDGVEQDLTRTSYATYDELAHYCYQVAGVVGLACIQIWGQRDAEAQALAITCGEALQLTNILRDLREDARVGRIYLPAEDLARFAFSASDLLAGHDDGRFRELLRFEIDRARQLYERGSCLGPLLPRPGRAAFRAIFAIYRSLLLQIEREPDRVLTSRISLSRWRKLRIAAGCLWQ